MQLVAFHLHGNALTWFIRWEQEIGHPTWPQFSQAIDRRFGPPIHHNHLGDLTSTHQTGELDDYTNQFLLTVVDAKVDLQTQRANTRIDIQSVPVDLTC